MSTNLSDLDRDRQIIASHGGPAKFARLLGIDDAGATQRVSNWLRRGIPASIKLAHLDLFVEAPLTESKEGA